MTSAPPLAPVGHDAVLTELTRLWGAGRGPRTLLFAGPQHVGRRLAARWLCALVNCSERAPGAGPCGGCESCRLLAAGTHPDLKEVAPAATTGSGRAKRDPEIRIDQLVRREQGDPEPLGPWLVTRPRYRVRVGVIDQAGSMNAAAANSFLKMLEEPPAWALVVLVAAGPEELLPTVASRCVTIRFGAVDPAAALHALGTDVAAAALEGHPALRLGQPGALLSSLDAALATEAARAAARAFASALTGDLLEALTGAEGLAKAVAAAADAGTLPGPLGWLRELLRDRPPAAYAAALDEIDACERAIAAYAQVPLACAVLALRLRQVGVVG